MRNLSTPCQTLGVALVLVLSACASDTPKPPEVSASSPAQAPPAAPQLQRPASAVPRRPAIQTGIIPGTLQDFEVNVGDHVFFAFDKSDLDDTARATLQKQAAWFSRYQAVTVAVQGNADERGTREYNLALGARRAAAVKDYLVGLGVRSGRLTTISFGKERPVCVESNETCWSKNRRAVSAIMNAVSTPNVAMGN
jgi:peptidoglycan-associated lipoprotein